MLNVEQLKYSINRMSPEQVMDAVLELRLEGVEPVEPDRRAELFALLDEAEIEFEVKDAAWSAAQRLDGLALVATLHALDLPEQLLGAMIEVLAADPR